MGAKTDKPVQRVRTMSVLSDPLVEVTAEDFEGCDPDTISRLGDVVEAVGVAEIEAGDSRGRSRRPLPEHAGDQVRHRYGLILVDMLREAVIRQLCRLSNLQNLSVPWWFGRQFPLNNSLSRAVFKLAM